MSRLIYDNWGRLVEAAVKKAQLTTLAYADSSSDSCTSSTESESSATTTIRLIPDTVSTDGELFQPGIADNGFTLAVGGVPLLDKGKPQILQLEQDHSFRANFSSGQPLGKPKRRLDRLNAMKSIYFESSPTSVLDYSSTSCYSPEESPCINSQDLDDGKTSFRIDGIGQKFENFCKRQGFLGIDDFAIPTEEYEMMKMKSFPVLMEDRKLEVDRLSDDSGSVNIRRNLVMLSANVIGRTDEHHRNGIKGTRPPPLAPPPLMSLPVIDNNCSTWDIFRAFGPDGGTSGLRFDGSFGFDDNDGQRRSEEDEDHRDRGERAVEREENNVLSGSFSFTTTSNDNTPSTTADPMSSISPDGRFRHVILKWQKGALLGRGSFGSVYEGIADAGFFFAVKEVSLLDQGDEGKQRILQLEREIALLSWFKHENIVQYYGTKKDQSNLYIFLELVNRGSLLSLYRKYNLQDSHVSAYTRQILHGLKYLHNQKVIHRDIKCANILVDTNGSVKLADFGLAKATELNTAKSFAGSAFWMAPEVVRSLGYGIAADIWSLGCTVLEMLTRCHPYPNLEGVQALFKIGEGERPPIPASLSWDARDFILQCLQVEPSLRPTAMALLDHPFVNQPLPSPLGSASPNRYTFRQI